VRAATPSDAVTFSIYSLAKQDKEAVVGLLMFLEVSQRLKKELFNLLKHF